MKFVNFSRRAFLQSVGLAAAVFATPGCFSNLIRPKSSRSVKPNIIFILADDLGWADVGYHDSEILTPNIDCLAREGVRLEQHYVMPTCSPTRTCLMSGRYPSRFGVLSPTNNRVFDFDQVTLASALRSQGYDTFISGKWHLGSKKQWGPLKFGFNHSYGSLAGGVTPYGHLYKKGPYSMTWYRDDEPVEESGHVTDLIGREAVRYIESSADSKSPFFIYVPFTAVHIPIKEDLKWLKYYDKKIMNESRKRFAACATHLDAMVGKIVDAVEHTGQRENTLIIFTSDNGAQKDWNPTGKYPGEEPAMASPVLGSNRPLRGWKTELYEGGIRVPTLANWPSVLKPHTTTSPVHIVDWMPTLCGLAGFKPKQDSKWNGRDIWPLLTGRTVHPKQRTLYWRTPRQLALRHGDWKIIVTENQTELYNLAADPYEARNVTEENPEITDKLINLLANQRKLDAEKTIPFL